MSEESLIDDGSEAAINETTETVEQVADGAAPSWFHADNVAGEGDKPEWYKDNKYKSVADQAKAYTELEKKLGGFTGAPEGEYELSFPDGVEGEWIEGDPLMDGFKTWAKENNLSQDKFTDLLHLYVGNEAQATGVNRESELAAIGENAKGRLQAISQYAKANLSEEDYNGILQATTTAAGVKAIEALIAQTKNTKLPTDPSETTSGVTHSEIQARVADPRYASDPSFRKETTKMYEQLLGKGPKNKVVG